VFIFNDPRDWALDTQIILDLLLSQSGHLGSLSPKNGNKSLPNNGYQQDGQPPLYFSNPDLLWASAYHLPRLGQGGYKAAFEGVWKAVTNGANLERRMFGKPHRGTFAFAEKRLENHRHALIGSGRSKIGTEGLKRVYMVGDNPESDILGANEYQSASGSTWQSILVRSGVYSGGEPAHKPKVVVEDVWDAVQWGLEKEGWT
jgi:HAD superfamily hydrolase (TIGR01456 family)